MRSSSAISARASATASASRSTAALHSDATACSAASAARATSPAPMPEAEPFSVCANGLIAAGPPARTGEQHGGLPVEQLQQFAFEFAAAEGHAREARAINRR